MPYMQAVAAQGREIREYPLAAAQTFGKGAVVALDGNEEVIEANPAALTGAILGFAEIDAAVDPFPDRMSVSVAREGKTWWMPLGNAAGDSLDPEASDVGASYGLALTTAGDAWFVDRLTAGVVNVVSIDIARKMVEVEVETAARHFA